MSKRKRKHVDPETGVENEIEESAPTDRFGNKKPEMKDDPSGAKDRHGNPCQVPVNR